MEEICGTGGLDHGWNAEPSPGNRWSDLSDADLVFYRTIGMGNLGHRRIPGSYLFASAGLSRLGPSSPGWLAKDRG